VDYWGVKVDMSWLISAFRTKLCRGLWCTWLKWTIKTKFYVTHHPHPGECGEWPAADMPKLALVSSATFMGSWTRPNERGDVDIDVDTFLL
jgi:hypothetical protein